MKRLIAFLNKQRVRITRRQRPIYSAVILEMERRIEEVEKTFLLQVTAMDRNLEQHIINLRHEHAFHRAEILTQHVGSLLGQ